MIIVWVFSCQVGQFVGGNDGWGLDICTAFNESVAAPKPLFPLYCQQERCGPLITQCCNPPEVAAYIKLSWGQLIVAANPTGSCPLRWFLTLLSVFCDTMIVHSQPNTFFSSFHRRKTSLLNPSLYSYRFFFFAPPAMFPTLSDFSP